MHIPFFSNLFKYRDKLRDYYIGTDFYCLFGTPTSGYSIGRQNGWLSTSDIRKMEDMNPVPDKKGGNLYLVNGSMTKLKNAGAFVQKDENVPSH